jgi:hypothetical protein
VVAASCVPGVVGSGGGGLAMKGAVILMAAKSNVAVVGIVLLLLLAGAAVAYRQAGRPVGNAAVAPAPSRPHAAQGATAPTGPATAPAAADWLARFNDVYGLADGQTIKLVRPPYVAERRAFMKAMPKIGGLSPEEHQMTLEWDGRQATWFSMGGGRGSLGWFLQTGARLRPYELEDWGGKYALAVHGDWVVRKGASVQEKLDGVARLLSDELGHAVRFERRRVPREAVVVRGTYAYQTLDDSPAVAGAEVIEIVGKRPLPDRETMVAEGTIGQFCRHLESVLVCRVIDETGGAGKKDETRLKWRDHRPGSGEANHVLAKLEWQTSLRLTQETRETDVWFMVEVKP